MNIRRLKAIAKKECIHVIRDWRSLAISLAIPLLLILLFSYALNMDLNQIPTVVSDRSNTPLSREFVSILEGSLYFNIKARVTTNKMVENELVSGNSLVGFVIPEQFSQKIKAGKSANIQVLIDASDANVGLFALNYAKVATIMFNRKVALSLSQFPKKSTKQKKQLSMVSRPWYNQDLRSRNVIVPGVIAIVMVIIAAMLTSVTVAKEWETGTMEQLISTPLHASEIVLGKAFPYFVIGLIDLSVSVFVGHTIFGVPFRGNLALLFILSSFFLTGSLFFGLLLSIKLKQQVVASQMALMSGYLPTLLLSGFVFAIPNMATFLQLISKIVPAKYFITILKGIYLKGVGLEVLFGNAFAMVFYALLMVFLAKKNLKLYIE